tara:strand:+ start:105 stop:1400 length:1296 start_codon:yes stop_codon:yes gene_type:complete
MQVERVMIDELDCDPANVRAHDSKNLDAIKSSLKRFGQQKPIVVNDKGIVIAGNGTLTAARSLGWDSINIITTELDGVNATAYAIADNRTGELAEWDEEALAKQLSALQIEDEALVEAAGFSDAELTALVDEVVGEPRSGTANGRLVSDFIFPPFTVLSARSGPWQERKKEWLGLGIESEVGRDSNLLRFSDTTRLEGKDTSIFDPVLCELVYSWFSPIGGQVLDPFAGGSVRGIVASYTGRKYMGVELRQEQVEANQKQSHLAADPVPEWINGNSQEIDNLVGSIEADLVFSCPPYVDLEVYSDNPEDLSTMAYDDFKKAYFEIIKKSCAYLKNDRFACFVVGEVRDKKGNYLNFVGDTVEAFRAAGLEFYNEAILVTCVSSLPMRAGGVFSASRKLGKTHQNVLVFVKGCGKKAAEFCGPVETRDLPDA